MKHDADQIAQDAAFVRELSKGPATRPA